MALALTLRADSIYTENFKFPRAYSNINIMDMNTYIAFLLSSVIQVTLGERPSENSSEKCPLETKRLR